MVKTDVLVRYYTKTSLLNCDGDMWVDCTIVLDQVFFIYGFLMSSMTERATWIGGFPRYFTFGLLQLWRIYLSTNGRSS